MTDTSYYEIYIRGDEVFRIDLGDYGAGRSSRTLPTSITLTLTSYRWRPGTTASALFQPALTVVAKNASSNSQKLVSTIVSKRRIGASVGLASRLADSNSNSTDAAASGWSVTIPIDSAYLPVIELSIDAGGVYAEVVTPVTTLVPIKTPGADQLFALVTEAVNGKRTFASINALEFPAAITIRQALAGATLHEQIHDVGTTPEQYIAYRHSYVGDTRQTPTKSSINLITTNGFEPSATEGGPAWLVSMSGDANNWVSEAFQKGATFAVFFARGGFVFFRFDIYVGATTNPGDTDYPAALIDALIQPLVTVKHVWILPYTALPPPHTGPSTNFYQCAALPILNPETSHFSGTVELSIDV